MTPSLAIRYRRKTLLSYNFFLTLSSPRTIILNIFYLLAQLNIFLYI